MRWFSTVVITLFTISLFSHSAWAKDTITWIITEWPPYQYEENGVYKGYGVEAQHLIEAELAEYEHKTISANFARLISEIKTKNSHCAFGILKAPAREEYGHFSEADLYFLPNVVFMHKDKFEELGNPASISLEKLLSDKKNTFALSVERSFGVTIDNLLEEAKSPGHTNIEYLYTGEISNTIFKRLIHKRIDFTIEFPVEGNYIARQLGGDQTIVPVIIEEESGLLNSHTICSKNEWGLKVVKRINQALEKIHASNSFQQLYEKKLEDNLIPAYRQQYHEQIEAAGRQ